VKTIFVDANVFLRFFTTDDAGQQARAAQLFRSAVKGKVLLVTGPPVLFEIAWTLRSAYKASREEVLNVLSSVIAMPGLTLVDSAIVKESLARARKSRQEFADAYLAASTEKSGADEVATFNRKHFEKLSVNLHDF